MLWQNIPKLLAVAEQVGRRKIVGLAAYKPANSHSEKEPRAFSAKYAESPPQSH